MRNTRTGLRPSLVAPPDRPASPCSRAARWRRLKFLWRAERAIRFIQKRRRNLRRGLHFALIGCLALALVLSIDAGQKKAPSGSLFAPEKGKFDVLLDGKSVGREEFDIAPGGAGWIAKGTTKLNPPGAPPSTVTGNLVLQPDGVPVSYEWTSQTDKTNSAHIAFVGGVAKMTLEMQGARPFEQDLSFNSPLIAVLDNNLYHHYAILARIYDWSKGGSQTFSVLIPQDLTPGSITVDSAGAVTVEGKTYEGLKVITADLEVMLYLDPNHKLMRLEVPSAKVAVVRQ